MKKRLLAMALATAMLFTSFNVVYAEDANTADTAVESQEVAPVDNVATGSATDNGSDTTADDSTTSEYGIVQGVTWPTTDPWKASVFGNVGGQTRISHYGDTTWSQYVNGQMTYDVQENGNEVTLRMGVPNYTDSTQKVDAQGKISADVDGIVYYYQELKADDDFTISAKAHVNGVWNANNQVSFGLMVRDKVYINTQTIDGTETGANLTSDDLGDEVAAGSLNMVKAGSGMNFAFTRTAGALDSTSWLSSDAAAPTAGSEYDVSIKKSGTNYTVTFGNDTAVIDGSSLTMTDDIYAGLYVARCADVTFSNVSLKVAGAAAEVGEMTVGGNGLCGNVNADVASENYVDFNKLDKTSDSAFKLTIDTAAAMAATGKEGFKSVGKLSTSEDSYAYYASQISKDDDFVLSGSMKLAVGNNVGSSGVKAQGGAGIAIFDSTYKKSDGITTGNSLMIGAMSTDSETAYIDYRTAQAASDKTSATVKVENILSDSIGSNAQEYADTFTYRVKKSGDNVKITVNGTSVDVPVADLFGSSDQLYVGYFVARDGYVDVTDHQLSVGSKKAASAELVSGPTKSEYYVGEAFDYTGLQVKVTYTDGTTDILSDLDDITLTGFDETKDGASYFNSIGEKTVKASVGSVSVDVPITVRAMKVTDISISYEPVRTTFLVNTAFDSNGLTAVATFEDGTTKTLTKSTYKLYLDGAELSQLQKLTSAQAGTHKVQVMYTDTDATIDPAGVYNEYEITVKNATLNSIRIATFADKVSYVEGEDFETAGLTVEGSYTLDDGTTTTQILDPSLYTVTGYDANVLGTQTITITYTEDTSVTTTYDVSVNTVAVVRAQLDTYPLLTYMVGDDFDPSGMEVSLLYNTGATQNIDMTDANGDTVYYLFDGTSYTDSNGNVVTEEEAEAANYYVDLSQFNTSAVGTGKIVINVSALGFTSSIEYTTSVIAKKDYVWKGMLFGASSLGVSGVQTSKSSEIHLFDNAGNEYVNTSDDMQFEAQTMTNGKLDNVSAVRLNSWTQAGKQSGDQDGIAYFYTMIDADQNFKLSADVTVNRYIKDPTDPTDDAAIRAKMVSAKDEIEDLLDQRGVAESERETERYKLAMDMLRTGQEAFGIEARDVIPFAGGLDADGNYTGGLGNHMTTSPDLALKDENGQPMNIYEAYRKGVVVTDKDGKSYQVTYADVENTFASNIVVAGATTDSTWPASPTGTSDSGSSSSYYKKTQMNRINILIRKGVIATDGGGSRVGIKDTTDSLPLAGDKYNITLQKLNEGYMIKTYNYQTGETRSEYDSLSELNIDKLLDSQDDSYMTVGFYACRWADATFENIEFHEIDPLTDQTTIPLTESEYSPEVTVKSSNYTTTTDYKLVLKANNPSGGRVDISLNGELIMQDRNISKKTTFLDTTLVPDSTNEFTIVYKPSTADNCISYDPVVTRFLVTQKSNIKDYSVIYVSPDGTDAGDGTRENPLDFESAIGVSTFGTTIIMLDGTYNIKNTEKGVISIGQELSGKDDARKTIKADDGANPIIDLQGLYEGFSVSASYWTFDGITVTNAKGNGKAFVLGGHYDVVKNCTFHDNGELGFQIGRLVSTEYTIADWPSDNLVLNCESYNNNDPSKNNADGFAAKLTTGYNNVFSGCISHHNLDDGWDCYTKLATGAIGAESLENCVSYKQGYGLNEDGTEFDWENGAGCNGFKMGGENIHVAHYLKDCISFDNKRSGVDSNYNPGFKMRNVITYNNEGANLRLYSGTGNIMKDENGSQTNSEGLPYKFDYDMKGVVSAANPDKGATTNDVIGSLINEDGTEDTIYANLSKNPIVSESNYISYAAGTQGVNSNGEAVDPASMFKSIDRSDVLNAQKRYTRKADGSFELGDFLARKVAYVHDSGDEVVYPDVEEKTTASTVTTETTETTTAATESTETTTVKKTSGGGGSGAVVNSSKSSSVTTTEAATGDEATEATTDENGSSDVTEPTTSSAKTDAAFTVNPPAADGTAPVFSDVPAAHWANEAVETLAKAGIVNGITSDIFGVNTNTKRADFAVMLVRALGIDAADGASFSDVDSSKYYADAVATAKAYGIVNGYSDGTFRPESNITRQEMMVMVVNALKAAGATIDTDTACLDSFNDASDIASYARTSVAALVNAGIVNGSNGAINPVKDITRAETAQIVKGVYDIALGLAE